MIIDTSFSSCALLHKKEDDTEQRATGRQRAGDISICTPSSELIKLVEIYFWRQQQVWGVQEKRMCSVRSDFLGVSKYFLLLII